MFNLRAHVPPLYDMWWLGAWTGLTRGVRWWGRGKLGELAETPRSPGAVIKMAPWFGDEKACSALCAHWRCSPAYLEHPLFMSFYKFQLTFLSVLDVCFWFGYTGCVCPPPNKNKILVRYKYFTVCAGFLLLPPVCFLFFTGVSEWMAIKVSSTFFPC